MFTKISIMHIPRIAQLQLALVQVVLKIVESVEVTTAKIARNQGHQGKKYFGEKFNILLLSILSNSRHISTNTRSSSSASSSYILDYGNSSEKSSFDVDSRRSSGEGAYSSQPPSSILSNKQFFENMSPISEISTCSTMVKNAMYTSNTDL